MSHNSGPRKASRVTAGGAKASRRRVRRRYRTPNARRSLSAVPHGALVLLARETGATPSHLSRYLSGERPSKRLDALLLTRFGIAPEALLAARTLDEWTVLLTIRDEVGETHGEQAEALAVTQALGGRVTEALKGPANPSDG